MNSTVIVPLGGEGIDWNSVEVRVGVNSNRQKRCNMLNDTDPEEQRGQSVLSCQRVHAAIEWLGSADQLDSHIHYAPAIEEESPPRLVTGTGN